MGIFPMNGSLYEFPDLFTSRDVQLNPALFIGLVLGLALIFLVRYRTSPWRKLPPGPRGLPLLGNALQLKEEQWFLFSTWRKSYGDIFYLNAAGQPIVVINRHDIATELLDRRAGKYTDRPLNIVGWEIMCDGLLFAFGRYNIVWRRMRKASHEAVNKLQVRGLHEYQVSEALALARSGLQNPSAWDDHVRRAAASLMLSGLYGEPQLAGDQDSRVKQINTFSERVTSAIAPGAYWVEMMPWMRYIPSRIAPWKRSAEAWHRHDNGIFCGLYEGVRERIAKGDDRPSFCSTLIHEPDRYGLSSRESAWMTATMYGAGSDTSSAAMSWWSLAMLAFPDAQRRAQNELNTVVGRARVPTFTDMSHLPYISAMVKEVNRWRPVTPLALPHCSTEDDVYEGYFIPKGTVIIPNVWELNHDPETYGSDAHLFNPARYLDKEGRLTSGPPGMKDDGHFSFGFGRRICVGKHVAANTLFIQIATCLWAFTLSNVEGQELDVNAFHDEGVIVRPKPFQVDIKPRFPETVALLSQECELRGR